MNERLEDKAMKILDLTHVLIAWTASTMLCFMYAKMIIGVFVPTTNTNIVYLLFCVLAILLVKPAKFYYTILSKPNCHC